jgi:hypothetical protein
MSGRKVQNDYNKFNELQRSSATTRINATQASITPTGGKGEEKETGMGFFLERVFDLDFRNPKTLIPVVIAGAVVGFLVFGA